MMSSCVVKIGSHKKTHIDIRDWGLLKLEDFVPQNTMRFFHILVISTEFLKEDPLLLDSQDNNNAGLRTVQQLEVINDNSKRGVTLFEQCNTIITNDETEFALYSKTSKLVCDL